MTSEGKEDCCASAKDLEEHVEEALMHSSFKGPPSQETNRPLSEGQSINHQSMASGDGYSRESNSGRGGVVGHGMEENLDASIHRGDDEPINPDSSRAGLLSSQAAARGDSDSDSDSSFLRLSARSSPSSDDGFERVNTELISLQNSLRESEKKRKELEQALKESEEKRREMEQAFELSQRKADEAVASRRRADDQLSAAHRETRELQEMLDMKDRKLDVKRREIIRIRQDVQVYGRDFTNLNERAIAAEAAAERIASGWSADRRNLYEAGIGLNQRTGTRNEAHNEAHNQHTQRYPVPRTQPRTSSPGAEVSHGGYVILPPRYNRLEADSRGDSLNPSRAEDGAQDEEETMVMESFGIPVRSEHGSEASGDSLSRSVNGNEIAYASDDLDQLVDDMEIRANMNSLQ